MSTQDKQRFLGITVLGDYILCEGPQAVLDNVCRAGADAVACNPTVTAPAAEGTGSFQPPIDAGSSPRVFDRPLFGKRALWVQSGPSFRPNPDCYKDSPYPPRQPNELTEQHGHVIGEFIDGALERGLKVYFQIRAVQPSGLRDDDRPRLPNGKLPKNRIADTGCLASEAIRAYNRAYIRDLLTAYPGITGFRPDWPESPCYTLGEAFQDFSPHVKNWADQRGVPFEGIRQQAAELYEYLHGKLTNDDLHQAPWMRVGTSLNLAEQGRQAVLWLNRFPELTGWLCLKTALSVDILREWRKAMTEFGGQDKELAANAFMPPYTLLTGFDFSRAAELCDAIAPKLYTMHWSLMIELWGKELLEANPGLDERLLVRALVHLMDLADPGQEGERMADYGYPQPDEPHPIPDEPQRRKIVQAIAATGGKAALLPLVHGYGPLEDFSRRLKLVAESEADGVWINRYGYLSDDKLNAIADIWKSA